MLDEKLEENEHHHHDHDDDCDCGCHDHEHEHHHHDHDEDCDCGCHDHDHEHHHHDHDDDCDCGCHDHDHEHHHHHEHGEDCDCDDCVSGVSIIHHDEALAGSFHIETKKSKEELDAILREGMEKIKDYVDGREGVIGHIKAAITHGDDAAMYSLTYDIVQRVGEYDTLTDPDQVSMAAIVYGAEEHELREILVSIKEKIEA